MAKMSASDAALIADWLSKNEVTRPNAEQCEHYAAMECEARDQFAADDKAYYDQYEPRYRVWDSTAGGFSEGSVMKSRISVAADG
jgi:hypothetical protein